MLITASGHCHCHVTAPITRFMALTDFSGNFYEMLTHHALFSSHVATEKNRKIDKIVEPFDI